MTYPPDRYTGDAREMTATFRAASQAAELKIATITEAAYLATGATTDGQFGPYRWDMGPQPAGPAPHFHKSITESFFILTGTVRLYDGQRWFDAAPGDFVYVPQGGIHAFRNESGAPASMLLLFTPGAPREGYFQALADAAASGRAMTADDLARLYAAHDTYMA